MDMSGYNVGSFARNNKLKYMVMDNTEYEYKDLNIYDGKNFYTKEEATKETTGRGKVTRAGLPMQNKNKFNQKIYDDLFGADPSIGLRNQKETLLPGFISEIGRAFTNSVT